MNKVVLFACSLLFALSVAGIAGATTFTNTQTFDVTIGEGPLAQLIWGDSFSYQHSTPADFEVPWDVVNSATLSISGYWINGSNDPVLVEGTAVGTLTPGGSYGGFWIFAWDTPSLSTFDISSTFNTWSTGSPLGITIAANGDCFDGIIELDKSIFTLEYDNGTAPVPEPGTIVLLGAGLLGLGFFGKRRMKKA